MIVFSSRGVFVFFVTLSHTGAPDMEPEGSSGVIASAVQHISRNSAASTTNAPASSRGRSGRLAWEGPARRRNEAAAELLAGHPEASWAGGSPSTTRACGQASATAHMARLPRGSRARQAHAQDSGENAPAQKHSLRNPASEGTCPTSPPSASEASHTAHAHWKDEGCSEVDTAVGPGPSREMTCCTPFPAPFL